MSPPQQTWQPSRSSWAASSSELPALVARTIRDWQSAVLELVGKEGASKRASRRRIPVVGPYSQTQIRCLSRCRQGQGTAQAQSHFFHFVYLVTL